MIESGFVPLLVPCTPRPGCARGRARGGNAAHDRRSRRDDRDTDHVVGRGVVVTADLDGVLAGHAARRDRPDFLRRVTALFCETSWTCSGVKPSGRSVSDSGANSALESEPGSSVSALRSTQTPNRLETGTADVARTPDEPGRRRTDEQEVGVLRRTPIGDICTLTVNRPATWPDRSCRSPSRPVGSSRSRGCRARPWARCSGRFGTSPPTGR